MRMNLKRKCGIRLLPVWFGAICWACCACGSGTRSGVPSTDISALETAIDSAVCGPVYDRDSLYAVLIGKLGAERRYTSVIRFLADSLVPQYNFYEFDNRSECLFAEPLRYLTRTELDAGRSLVTLAEDDRGEFHYLLLDASDSIVWHRFSDTQRTRILKREFRDWDADGKKEIVELRENTVSGFVTTKEYVFSVGEKGLMLQFCIELSGASWIGADSLGGYLTRRSYRFLDNGLYRITERKSRCDDEGNPQGTVSVVRYTLPADSLLVRYGDWEN